MKRKGHSKFLVHLLVLRSLKKLLHVIRNSLRNEIDLLGYYLEHESHCESNEFSIPSLRVQVRANKSRMDCVDMHRLIGSQ